MSSIEAEIHSRAAQAKDRLWNKPLRTPAERQKVLAADPFIEPKYPAVLTIKKIVADYYSVTCLDIDSCRIGRGIARPRHVAIYLTRLLTLHGFPEIGRRFGGRDHSTIYACTRKMEETIEAGVDLQLLTEIDELKTLIAGRT